MSVGVLTTNMKQTQVQSDLQKILQVTTLLLLLNELRSEGHKHSGFAGKWGQELQWTAVLILDNLPSAHPPYQLILVHIL